MKRYGRDPFKVILVSNGEYYQARWRDSSGRRGVKSLGPKEHVPRDRALRDCGAIRDGLIRADERAKTLASIPDGPRPPCVLRWGGVDHKLSPQTWRAVAMLWDRQSVTVGSFVAAVWGGDEPSRGAMHKLVAVVNNQTFAKLGIPWRVSLDADAVSVERALTTELTGVGNGLVSRAG